MNLKQLAQEVVDLVKVDRTGRECRESMPRWLAELAIASIPTDEPEVAIARIEPIYVNRTAWYPQSPTADYAPARIRISVPSEFQVVASGTLVNLALNKADVSGARRTDSGLIRTVEYVSDRPLRYLACDISRRRRETSGVSRAESLENIPSILP